MSPIKLKDLSDFDYGVEEEASDKVQWTNKFEYTLSLLGYSVGLGNLWRFPYICQLNGGGAFLIPYVIFTVIMAMPLFFLEVSLGQFTKKGPVGIWTICPLMKGTGFGMWVLNGMGIPYYSMVMAWALYFFYHSFSAVLPWTTCGNDWNTIHCVATGTSAARNFTSTAHNFTSTAHNFTSTAHNITSLAYNYTSTAYNFTSTAHNFMLGANDRAQGSYNLTKYGQNETVTLKGPTKLGHTSIEEFWQYKVLNISPGIEDLGSVQTHILACWAISCFIVFLCVMKGIRSVGKVVYVTALVPYVLLTVLLVRACMMPGALDGILFYVTPDFALLTQPKVWLEAFIQIFFSVGMTWGAIIVMSSHNSIKNNVLRDTILVTSLGELTSVYAGFAVFATVGFLAHDQQLPVSDVISSGPGIGFIVYPGAVSLLPFSQIWAVLFFLMLLMMAIDTIFGNVETSVDCAMEILPKRWHGKHTNLVVAGGYLTVVFCLGIVVTTKGGVYVYQLMDWYIAAVFCFVTAFIECIVVGWIYGVQRFSRDVHYMTGIHLPVTYKLLCFIVIPIFLIIVTCLTLSSYKPPKYGSYEYPELAVTVGWCVAFAGLVPIVLGMFIQIATSRGTFLQRLGNSLTPEMSLQRRRERYGLEEFLQSNTFGDNFQFMFKRQKF